MQETADLTSEAATIKIDPQTLDKLMSLSGELVIIRSQYARLEGLLHLAVPIQPGNQDSCKILLGEDRRNQLRFQQLRILHRNGILQHIGVISFCLDHCKI